MRHITLTIPTAEEVRHLLQSPPQRRPSEQDIEYFLRDLHESYPNSRLLVHRHVDLIETSCITGIQAHTTGVIAILEQLDPPAPDRRYPLHLLGGPTGHESFYVPPEYHLINWGKSGWSACAGTPGRWNACYLVPDSMFAVGVDFLQAYLHGPTVTFPPRLTDEERQRRLDDARSAFLASMRRNMATQAPPPPTSPSPLIARPCSRAVSSLNNMRNSSKREARMTRLRRAQIRAGVKGIDTTVKSAQGLWRALAPKWDMVMGLKNGTLSWEAYCVQYTDILARVPMAVWDALARAEQRTLLCYCRDGWNCHTHEIIAFAVRQFPDRFSDGRDDSCRPPA